MKVLACLGDCTSARRECGASLGEPRIPYGVAGSEAAFLAGPQHKAGAGFSKATLFIQVCSAYFHLLLVLMLLF